MLARIEKQLRESGDDLRADEVRRARGILAYVHDLVDREPVADWRDRARRRLEYLTDLESEEDDSATD